MDYTACSWPSQDKHDYGESRSGVEVESTNQQSIDVTTDAPMNHQQQPLSYHQAGVKEFKSGYDREEEAREVEEDAETPNSSIGVGLAQSMSAGTDDSNDTPNSDSHGSNSPQSSDGSSDGSGDGRGDGSGRGRMLARMKASSSSSSSSFSSPRMASPSSSSFSRRPTTSTSSNPSGAAPAALTNQGSSLEESEDTNNESESNKQRTATEDDDSMLVIHETFTLMYSCRLDSSSIQKDNAYHMTYSHPFIHAKHSHMYLLAVVCRMYFRPHHPHHHLSISVIFLIL